MRILFVLFSIFLSQSLPSQVLDLYPTEVNKLSFPEEIKKLYEERYVLYKKQDNKQVLTELERKRLDDLINNEKLMEQKMSWWDVFGMGCSWYCCGNIDTVIASSNLNKNGKITYIGANAGDDNYETAWVEGVDGYGIGESVTFYITTGRVDEIIIANGYVKTPKAYKENSRVKTLKLYYNDKHIANLHLRDEISDQYFKLWKVFGTYAIYNSEEKHWLDVDGKIVPQWSFKFKIADVYEGTKYDDTVISEIYFSGPCH